MSANVFFKITLKVHNKNKTANMKHATESECEICLKAPDQDAGFLTLYINDFPQVGHTNAATCARRHGAHL